MNQIERSTGEIKPVSLQFHINGIEPEALLSVDDTARLLGHSKDWIYRRIYQGLLRTQMIAGRHVITGEDLAAYIDTQVPYGPVSLGCGTDTGVPQ